MTLAGAVNPASIASVEGIYKYLYDKDSIRNSIYRNFPFFAMVPKWEGLGGEGFIRSLIYGAPQNVSGSWATANTQQSTSQVAKFILTPASNYASVAVDYRSLLSSQSDAMAFIDQRKNEMDNTLLEFSGRVAAQLYRSGTGSLGNIASTATINSSSVKVALSNPADILNIEIGQNIAFSATDGGTLRSYASTSCYVIQVDRDAGSFLCSATYGGSAAALTSLITSVAVGDYIYASAGDLNAVISGAAAWLPGSAVTSTTFFNVNRAVDPIRLAGIAYNGSAVPIEEAIQTAAMKVFLQGGRGDHLFLNPIDMNKLELSLGSKRQYIQNLGGVSEGEVSINFSGLRLNGAGGEIKVFSDPKAPQGKGFMFTLDTWKLRSIGSVIDIFRGDTLEWVRDPSGDNLLLRLYSYAQLDCLEPAKNCIITLPSN